MAQIRGTPLKIVNFPTVPRPWSEPSRVPTQSIPVWIIIDSGPDDPSSCFRSHPHLNVLRLVHELLLDGYGLAYE